MHTSRVLSVLLLGTLIGCSSIGEEDYFPLVADQGTSKESVTGQITPASMSAPTSSASVTKMPVGQPIQFTTPGPSTALPATTSETLANCNALSTLSASEQKKRGVGYVWRKTSTNPYKDGTVEQALASSGWPEEVKRQFLDQISRGQKRDHTIIRGETFDWMAFGKPVQSKARVTKNVVACLDKNAAADMYVVTHGGRQYTLYRPHDCNNWGGKVRSIETSRTTLAPVTSGPCTEYTLFVQVRERSKLPVNVQQELDRLMQIEESTTEFSMGPSVSRTLGRVLRQYDNALAQKPVRVVISLMDPSNARIATSERVIGDLTTTNGVAVQTISAAMLDGKMVRVAFPAVPDLISPPSKIPNVQELRIARAEWGGGCKGATHGVLR